MTPERFGLIVRERIVSSAVEATKKSLNNPPGRKPAPALVEMSRKYLALSDPDKELALEISERAVEQAIFSLFVMLDGSSVVFEEVPPGKFVLQYVGKTETVTLADSDQFTDLHDCFNSG